MNHTDPFQQDQSRRVFGQMTGVLPSLIRALRKNVTEDVAQRRDVISSNDNNKNGIPDVYERLDVSMNAKLTDDPRYQMANPIEKVFMHVLKMWGVNVAKMKDIEQLKAEGVLSPKTKPAGMGVTIAVLLLFLLPVFLFIGGLVFVAFIFLA